MSASRQDAPAPRPADPQPADTRDGTAANGEDDAETASEGAASPENPGSANEAKGSGSPAIQCPNCGRTFDSRYCPDCGLAAGRPQTALGVVGTFLQELVDLRRGLGPTFKALLARPGTALRQHLGSGRRPLMNPGRYLLAAVIVNFGTVRVLTWSGAQESTAQRLSVEAQEAEETAGGAGGAEEEVLSLFSTLAKDLEVALASQTYYIASSLLLAIVLTFTIWRLFDGQIRQGAQALAFSFFTVGQAVFLETIVTAPYVAGTFLATGEPADVDSLVAGTISVAYVTAAAWRTFGPDGWAAGKGALAAVWAITEQALAITSAVVGYSLWLVYSRAANRVPSMSLSLQDGAFQGRLLWAGLGVVVLSVAPLLVHAAYEAQDRL